MGWANGEQTGAGAHPRLLDSLADAALATSSPTPTHPTPPCAADKLRFRLVSILSRGDEEFAASYCGRLADEYAVFKLAWVRQFYEQVSAEPALAPRAGTASRLNLLSQRLWAGETTDELWL